MPSRIEGYVNTDADDNPPSEDAAWVGPLRREARHAMVRRLVMERIAQGGYENFPAEKRHEFDWNKILETFLVGTAVAITAHLVVGWLRGK